MVNKREQDVSLAHDRTLLCINIGGCRGLGATLYSSKVTGHWVVMSPSTCLVCEDVSHAVKCQDYVEETVVLTDAMITQEVRGYYIGGGVERSVAVLLSVCREGDADGQLIQIHAIRPVLDACVIPADSAAYKLLRGTTWRHGKGGIMLAMFSIPEASCDRSREAVVEDQDADGGHQVLKPAVIFLRLRKGRGRCPYVNMRKWDDKAVKSVYRRSVYHGTRETHKTAERQILAGTRPM